MIRVVLEPLDSRGKKDNWTLEMDDDGVRAYGPGEDPTLKFTRQEFDTALEFPSFWLSVKHLSLQSQEGEKFTFRPHKDAIAAIREYLDRGVLRDGPAAIQRVRNWGLAMVGLGIFLFPCGIALGAFSLYRFNHGQESAAAHIRYGGFAPALFGLIVLVFGVKNLLRADKLSRRADEETADEEERPRRKVRRRPRDDD